MNDLNEFPAYNEPLETNSASGQNAPNAFATGDAPATPLTAPPVVGWYKVYAGFMAFLYLVCMIGGMALLKYTTTIVASAPNVSATELKIRAVIMAVIGIVLFVAYVVALALPNSSGAWIYHLVMIGIGLTSCCLWPATIPLLISWIKPETQRWFGRATPGVLPPSQNPNVPPPPIPPA